MAKLKDYTGNQVDKIVKPKPAPTQPSTAPVKPKMSPAPSTPKEDIKYLRDKDTGKPTGLELSDGRTFTGLDPRDVLKLAAGFQRSLAKTTLPQEQPVVPQVAQPLNNITPEQISQVGTPLINPGTPDTLTQDIQSNVETQGSERVQVLDQALGGLVPGITLRNFTGAGVKVLNRIAPGTGNAMLEAITKNDNIKSYLKNYSNQDNYSKVKDNLEIAETNIAAAKELAKFSDRSSEAIQIYNEAIDKKRTSLQQLKMISQKDQEAYIKDVKKDMVTLENYFSRLQQNDDLEMQMNLRNAKMVGGVQ